MSEDIVSQRHENALLKVHFFYITFLLIAVVVVLATNDWTKLDGFTEYLNVAATVSSLLLAILAIIYSFVSSGSQYRFLGSIQSSASSIRSISSDMKAFVVEGQGLQSRAEERTKQLQDLVEELRGAITDVSLRTTEIAGAVSSLPTSFGELRQILNERKQPDEPVQESEQRTDKKVIASFLRRSSVTGLVALRGAMVAREKDTYIDLQKLLGARNLEYVWGYLVAFSATGFGGLEYPEKAATLKNAKGVSRLSPASEELLEALEEEWERRRGAEGVRGKDMVAKYEPLIADALVEIQSP